MIGYIYSLGNETNNDIFYIGKTLWPYERLIAHKCASRIGDTHMYSFLKKNNIHFTLEIVEEIETEDESDLYKAENYWIEQFRQWGFDLLNSINYLSRKKKEPPRTYITSRAYKMSKIKALLSIEAQELERSTDWLICKILTNYIESDEKITNPTTIQSIYTK